MLLKETIVKWNDACVAFDGGDFQKALSLLTEVADSAKLFFGMGVCNARLKKPTDAIKSFSDAIKRDEHLAVGYFERALVLHLSGRHEDCLADYDETLNHLRGNEMIDYRQLGLDFKLYACEVLFNRALAQLSLGMKATAIEDLQIATQLKKETRHSAIDAALVDAQRSGSAGSSKPFTVSSGFLFRPPQDKVTNSKDVEFIKGKGKVVAALDSQDKFTGFSGRKLYGGAQTQSVPMAMGTKHASQDDLSRSAPGPPGSPQIGRRRSMSTDSFDAKVQQQQEQYHREEEEKQRRSSPFLAPPRPTTMAPPSSSLPARPFAPKSALPSRPPASDTHHSHPPVQEPPASQGASPYYSTPKRTTYPQNAPPGGSASAVSGPHRPPPPRVSAPDAHSSAPPPVPAAQPLWARKPATGAATATTTATQSHTPSYSQNAAPPPSAPKVAAPTAALLSKFGGGVSQPAQDYRPASTASAVSGYSGLSGVSSAGDGMMKIKCHYKDTRVVQVPADASFDELYSAVVKKFSVSKITLKYKDEEGDLVCLADQGDYDMAREAMQNKLLLWCSD